MPPLTAMLACPVLILALQNLAPAVSFFVYLGCAIWSLILSVRLTAWREEVWYAASDRPEASRHSLASAFLSLGLLTLQLVMLAGVATLARYVFDTLSLGISGD